MDSGIEEDDEEINEVAAVVLTVRAHLNPHWDLQEIREFLEEKVREIDAQQELVDQMEVEVELMANRLKPIRLWPEAVGNVFPEDPIVLPEPDDSEFHSCPLSEISHRRVAAVLPQLFTLRYESLKKRSVDDDLVILPICNDLVQCLLEDCYPYCFNPFVERNEQLMTVATDLVTIALEINRKTNGAQLGLLAQFVDKIVSGISTTNPFGTKMSRVAARRLLAICYRSDLVLAELLVNSAVDSINGMIEPIDDTLADMYKLTNLLELSQICRQCVQSQSIGTEVKVDVCHVVMEMIDISTAPLPVTMELMWLIESLY